MSSPRQQERVRLRSASPDPEHAEAQCLPCASGAFAQRISADAGGLRWTAHNGSRDRAARQDTCISAETAWLSGGGRDLNPRGANDA